MADFELIFLFNAFFNTTFARLNDFLVGLFAMLAASHFVAAKLTRPMAWLVAGLYTVFSAAGQPGSDLATLISILPNRAFVLPTMIFLLIVAYSGAMIFFSRHGKA